MADTMTNTNKQTSTNVDAKNVNGSIGGKSNPAAAARTEAAPTNDTVKPGTGNPPPAHAMKADELKKLSNEDRARIDELLRAAGLNVTMDDICQEAKDQQETIQKLEEENQHQKEIVTMLTRYRFCPHSEKKKMLSKLTAQVTKKIDDMKLIPPELEGVSDEILEKLRRGELELLTDENGNHHLPGQGGADATEAGNGDGTGGNHDAPKQPGDTNTGNDQGDNGQGGDGQVGTGQGDNGQGGNGQGGNGQGGNGGVKAKGHPRRTKGSLEERFKNVERQKCYTSFEDVTGCKGNPPLDENGNPMVYIGEKYVRTILVRIPEHYIMYECYSQSFRCMTPEKPGTLKASSPEEGKTVETKTVDTEAMKGDSGDKNAPAIVAVLSSKDIDAYKLLEEIDEDLEYFSDDDMEETEYTSGNNTATDDGESDNKDSADAKEMKRGDEHVLNEDEQSDDTRSEDKPVNSLKVTPSTVDVDIPAYELDCTHLDRSLSNPILPEGQGMETGDRRTDTCDTSFGKEDSCPGGGQDTVHDPPG